MSHLRLVLAAARLVGLPAGAVDIEWVVVSDPGNAPDAGANWRNDAPGCGSVAGAPTVSRSARTARSTRAGTEWNEQISAADLGGGSGWGVRAGTLGPFGSANNLTASTTAAVNPTIEDVGFRVATLVPEPARVLLVLTDGLVLAAARRQRQPRK
jgi:hypothetical protein